MNTLSDEISPIPVPRKGIGCQSILSADRVLYKGYLRRRKTIDWVAEQIGAPTRWSQNYVVISKGCLYCYKNETDLKPSKCCSLYGFSGVQMCGDEIPSNVPWPFRVAHGIADKYSIYFSSASNESQQIWMKFLEEEIISVNNFRRRPSDTSRHLPKKPGIEPPSSSDSDYEDCDIYDSDSKSLTEEKQETKKPLPVQPKPSAPIQSVIKTEVSIKPKKILHPDRFSSVQELEQCEYEGVSETPSVQHYNKPKTLVSQAYWSENAKDGEKLLKSLPGGTYMLRDSTKKEVNVKHVEFAFVLLVNVENVISKFRVFEPEPDVVFLDWEGEKFENLQQLLEHFSINNLPGKERRLTSPYSNVSEYDE